MSTHRAALRDAGLRRMRRVTAAAVAGAGALALLFAGLAAKAFPGRTTQHSTVATRTAVRSAGAPRQTAPPLVSAGAAPAPAPAAPAPTAAPPVVVSGGS